MKLRLLKRKKDKLSDEELVKKIVISDDLSYFVEIYDRHIKMVYQKCLGFTKDQAEAKDLAHDVMVKIYLSLKKFNHKAKFSTWIYRITYNHCIDHENKKRKRNLSEEDIEWINENSGILEPDDSELTKISVDQLNDLLNEISPSEKSILLMKYQDGLSIKEIGKIVEKNESAVKMKLKRSKEKIIAIYESRKQ
ncbi:MAG: RNA polymerase sigma factor [Cytophagales bacterium]